MSVLRLEKISLSYDPKGMPILKEIDLSLISGERVALMGPSGTGKTTLLQIMGGLKLADSGHVYHNDQVSYLSQEFSFPPKKKVKDILWEGLEDSPENYHHIRDLIDFFSLHYKEDNFVDELSYGQKQRLAIARALVFSPKWLLLDEPFAHLDRMLRQEITQELDIYLKQKNIGLVMATHDFHHIYSLVDRVLLLHYAKIYQDASPKEIYQRPIDSFVARFLGPVNLWSGKITRETQKTQTKLGDFAASIPYELDARTDQVLVFSRPEWHRVSRLGKWKGIVSEIYPHSEGDYLRIQCKDERVLIRSHTFESWNIGEEVQFDIGQDQLQVISS